MNEELFKASASYKRSRAMYTRVRGVYIQTSLHKSLSRRQNQDQIKEYQVTAKVWQNLESKWQGKKSVQSQNRKRGVNRTQVNQFASILALPQWQKRGLNQGGQWEDKCNITIGFNSCHPVH